MYVSCNWCDTEYTVVGKKEDLKKILNIILDYFDLGEEEEGREEEFLTEKLGGNPKKYDNLDGYVREAYLLNDRALAIDAMEDCGPSDFRKVLEELFDVKVYYLAKIDTTTLFWTNDKEGKYFPARWAVFGNCEGWYADTKEEAEEIAKDLSDPVIKEVEIYM